MKPLRACGAGTCGMLASWQILACPAGGPPPHTAHATLGDATAGPVEVRITAEAGSEDAAAAARIVHDEGDLTDAGTRSPGEAPDTQVALQDALVEHHSFRQVLVGVTALPTRRMTWELLRGRERVRLRLFCQTLPDGLKKWPWHHEEFPTGIHANGQEREEASWTPPVSVTFEGARARDGKPMRLATAANLEAMWRCAEIVPVLLVTCTADRVDVLPSRAELIQDDATDTWRWDPSSGERITALSCKLRRIVDADSSAPGPDSPMRSFSADWPLVFAEPRNVAAGIEWVYENSESIVQKSAYRWMVVPP
jgi:hypothetical protein